jgi:hypothetical protein
MLVFGVLCFFVSGVYLEYQVYSCPTCGGEKWGVNFLVDSFELCSGARSYLVQANVYPIVNLVTKLHVVTSLLGFRQKSYLLHGNKCTIEIYMRNKFTFEWCIYKCGVLRV